MEGQIYMSRLAVYLLGSPRVELDGEQVHIPRRKALALLAYLAITGREHSRDALAAFLWPEYDQSSARAELRRMLSSLNRSIGHERLIVDRDTAAMDPNSGIWVDVHAFEEDVAACAGHDPSPSTPCPECVRRLSEAVALYEDDFLTGFSLPDSESFDDWQRLESQRLRAKLAGALERLAHGYVSQRKHEEALRYAQCWLSLDPLDEAAHRILMELHAQAGQRAAALRQYRQCVRTLGRELGAEPSPETTALYHRIRAAREPALRVEPAAVPQERVPAFLDAESSAVPEPVFVGREHELTRLGTYLASALAGQGGIAFVTGDAGAGKTALLRAFARRATAIQPDLLVAWGACDALVGTGVPYLPFRETLQMLTGDVERAWTSGAVTREQARQLWRTAPVALGLLADRGAALLNTLLPAHALLSRAQALLRSDAEVLARLRAHAAAAGAAATHLVQDQLFAQLADVLHELSTRRPLLLLLDDLQWADTASIDLLFHMSRHLTGSRMLIVGAYRPVEVEAAAVRTRTQAPALLQARHPLHEVVLELQRRDGDRSVQLDRATEGERRHWIDALLDSEPNRLDTGFRDALFERTGAHPLFTVELLRAMQGRGDLTQDREGGWTQSEDVRWDQLPARVEAVIEERLATLDHLLREVLTLASVEGETFTAQVVAAVQGSSERTVLRALSQELVARHRLLQDLGETQVNGRFLSRYRFAHVLFQQYLYRRLSAGERRLLHGEVAEALEAAHAGHTEELAAQLGHHYAEAGIEDKAVAYLSLAGDQARLAYAHQEAIEYYTQALALQVEGSEYEQAGRTLMKLALAYHTRFDFAQAHRAFEEGFAQWQRAGSTEPHTSLPPAPHALRIRWSGPFTLDPGLCEEWVSSPVIDHMFRGLVSLGPDLGLVPELAHSWQVLEEGYRYLFHLRRDAHWSDGTPVTAHDFEYAWKRVLDPSTASPDAQFLYSVKGARATHQRESTRPDDVGVRALDDWTLDVELEEPCSYLLYLLTHTGMYAVPRHLVQAHGAAWTDVETIVTNGPFRPVLLEKDRCMRLVRNPAYHGPFRGNVEQVELHLPPDPAVGLELYRDGSVDVLPLSGHIPEVDRVRREFADESVSVPSLRTIYLGFDVSRPPFDDPRVRRAFALATDREQLASVALRGLFPPATGGLVPPGMPGHSPGIGLPYRPDEARWLLAQAGYAKGSDFPALNALTALTIPLTPEHFQAQWRENLGIEVAWEVLDWPSFSRRMQVDLPHLHLLGWFADWPDPGSFLEVSPICEHTRWVNQGYRALLQEARHAMDQDQRIELLRQADRILVREAAIVPLLYGRWHLLVKPWIRCFRLSPLHGWYWQDIIIEPH
jgi:ABC-type oligopeptide transport system substrate-binding subunit/DNA-binding SARP family transcriptional activator